MPGTEISAADLLADEQAQLSDDDGDDGDDTTEFFREVFHTLDEKGFLDAYLAQQLDLDGDVVVGGSGGDSVPAQDAPGASDGMDLDADAVAQFGKVVIDQVGDRKLSEVVKFAENNPQTVNQLLQQAIGGEQ